MEFLDGDNGDKGDKREGNGDNGTPGDVLACVEGVHVEFGGSEEK